MELSQRGRSMRQRQNHNEREQLPPPPQNFPPCFFVMTSDFFLKCSLWAKCGSFLTKELHWRLFELSVWLCHKNTENEVPANVAFSKDNPREAFLKLICYQECLSAWYYFPFQNTVQREINVGEQVRKKVVLVPNGMQSHLLVLILEVPNVRFRCSDLWLKPKEMRWVPWQLQLCRQNTF